MHATYHIRRIVKASEGEAVRRGELMSREEAGYIVDRTRRRVRTLSCTCVTRTLRGLTVSMIVYISAWTM